MSLILLSVTALAQSSTFEPRVDRPGMDYRNFTPRNPDPEDCRDACLAERRCRAWTFVRAGIQGPAPVCWLKDRVPEAQGNDCCTSGIIRR
jgi:hypothetical protein